MRSGSIDVLRQHGFYATPRPLVGYVVRSVHYLLQSHLGKPRGLAEPSVTVLDPAAGAMIFLREAFGVGLRQDALDGGHAVDFLLSHLLPHFHAIELLPQLHEQGLRSMRRLLNSLHTPLAESRIHFQLGNALDPATLANLPTRSYSVILGNPPWRSTPASVASNPLLAGYPLPDGGTDEGCFQIDGVPLDERNPKWLQDDYVRFLRLAQRLVDQAGNGLVAFVLNHNCLEAATFRGLRHSLLRTFDQIYALDLHGSARKRERGPMGGPDQNVFRGVAQGAAVLLLVKAPGAPRAVFRSDLYGTRREKLRILSRTDVTSTPWTPLRPSAPLYLFAAQDFENERCYHQGIPLPQLFPVHSTGFITGNDRLFTSVDRAEIEARLERLRSTAAPELVCSLKGLTSLRADHAWRRYLTPYLARPFDERHVCSAPYLLERPRQCLMHHMRGRNLALVVPRQCKEEPGAFVTTSLPGHKAVSAYDINSAFPLFLNPDEDRRPNLASGLLPRLSDLYSTPLQPESLLSYVYALLYSQRYRRRFGDLLRRSFPRIFFPRDARAFVDLAGVGQQLISLHLLRHSTLSNGPFALEGDVSQPLGGRTYPFYSDAEYRVYLNGQGLYFEPVEPPLWSYRIGGYQVLRQWLRARSGRLLGHAESREIRAIAEALRRTLLLQETTDAIYHAIEESPLASASLIS